jgi:UDP-glucose 4-epimerase
MVKTFERVNKIKIPYKITNRRFGDLDETFCNPKKAERELGWKVKMNLEDICRDSWNYCLNYNKSSFLKSF